MILVIEDNEDFVWMLNERQRWDMLVVTNAVDALAQLQVRTFSTVLCDVHGIEKDGLTARDVIKHCMQIGQPCFITTNDPMTALELKNELGVEHVDKQATYSALATGGAA